MRAAPPVVALSLLAAAACDDGYEVVVVAGSDAVLTEGVSWELVVEREGCEAGAATGLAPTPDRVVHALSWRLEAEGPEVGALDPGHYGFYLRVRDEACTVRWAGCADVRAEAGGSGRVTITLAAVDGPGCDDGLACTGEESCDETGTCRSIPGTAPDCADDDACTVDLCAEPGECRHVPGDADADEDGFSCAEDCDDSDGEVSPDASEACNGLDDDCDEDVDEGDACETDDRCLRYPLPAGTFLACLRPMSWDEGVVTCTRHDAFLAAVEVEEATLDLIEDVAPEFPADWWIGANDVANEGEWVDASGASLGFSQWADGEPDGGEAEDCVLFSLPGRGWRDADCDDAHPVVCEVP
jgi:hypothetical protein